MNEKINKIMNKFKNIIINYYCIIMAVFLLICSIREYMSINGLTIYCVFYIVLAIIFVLCHLFKNKIEKSKLMNFFPKNKFMILIFVIVIITSVGCYKDNNDRILYQQLDASGSIGPIINNSYYQEIYTKDVSTNSIAVRFATYNRVNKAEYKFALLENDNVIVERNFNTVNLKDGQFYPFKFDRIKLDPNNNYKIEITPISADNENCITIFNSTKNNEINYKLLSSELDYVKLFVIFIFGMIFLSLNYIINTKKLSPEKFYMLCGIYLISIMVIIPPWNVPDEPVHYYRAYKLSQITFDKSLKENLSGTEIYGPTEWCINYSGIEVRNKVYSRSAIFDCLKEQENVTRNRRLAGSLAGNNPINHMFAATGIKVVDIFTNSPLLIFFAGRLANLIISFVIIYFAIKKAPKNKLIILLVATIPMFVQQMVSYSYDSVLNASCLFVLSHIINLYEKDKWTIKDWILLSIMALFIFSAKSIYIFVFVPLLFKKIKNKKKAIIKIGLTLLILFITYEIIKIWPNILASFNKSTEVVTTTVSNGQTNMSYILNNPLQLLPLVYNTFVMKGWFYLRSLFGYFGWFVFSIDNIYIWIYLIMMYLLLITKGLSQNIFNVKQKTASIISCLIMFAASFAAMYFYWSSYKLNYVDGVQGRYFLPLLGLLLVTLIPKKQRKLELEEKDIFTFINTMFIMFIILLVCMYY